MIDMELTKDQAATIALYLKRITWSVYERNAVDEYEACRMKGPLYQLQKALDDKGFDTV